MGSEEYGQFERQTPLLEEYVLYERFTVTWETRNKVGRCYLAHDLCTNDKDARSVYSRLMVLDPPELLQRFGVSSPREVRDALEAQGFVRTR